MPRPLGNEAEWLCALWFGSARGLSNDSCVYERVREREEKERQTEHLFAGSVYRGHDVQMFSTVVHAATCNSVYANSVVVLISRIQGCFLNLFIPARSRASPLRQSRESEAVHHSHLIATNVVCLYLGDAGRMGADQTSTEKEGGTGHSLLFLDFHMKSAARIPRPALQRRQAHQTQDAMTLRALQLQQTGATVCEGLGGLHVVLRPRSSAVFPLR